MIKKICYILLFLAFFACSDDPETKKDAATKNLNGNYDKNAVFDVISAKIDEKCAKTEDISPDIPVLVEKTEVFEDISTKKAEILFVGLEKEKIQPMAPKCIDHDGDYYGKYCGWGPDCDDNNPKFNVFCPDCTKQNYAGCPCLSVTTSCFTKNLKFIGVGTCKTGVQECKNGFWQKCIGEITPEAEICDQFDNNCNGIIDEGVKSSCENCDFGCFRQTAAPKTDSPFFIDENSKNIKFDKKDNVILDEAKKVVVSFDFIWIANSWGSTVSKLDTNTGKEIGRYKVCADPSRTAVDLNGDVWVACRSDGGVAKIINEKKNCVDKNKNGKIDTSFDKNKNGKIETDEMEPKLKDECIKFVVYPEGQTYWSTTPRAAGVDKNNFGWIGFWDKDRLLKLHPETGKEVDKINIKCSPYGLVIDQAGIIWVSGRGCASLVRVDPITKAVEHISLTKGYPYGINVDVFGKIWLAGTNQWTSRYDPITKKWAHVKHGPDSRGIATSTDGNVYVALDVDSAIAKINATTLKLESSISIGSSRFPVGIAVDHKGFVWAVNQSANSATKVDPKKGKVIGEYPVGNGPYTYSDMTGYTLFNYTMPKGYYVHTFGLFTAKSYVTEAKSVKKWEWIDIKGQFPKNSSVMVYYRAGFTPKGIEKVPWAGPFGPFPPEKLPIDLTKQNVLSFYLQVKVVMQANLDKKSPILEKIIVQSHIAK